MEMVAAAARTPPPLLSQVPPSPVHNRSGLPRCRAMLATKTLRRRRRFGNCSPCSAAAVSCVSDSSPATSTIDPGSNHFTFNIGLGPVIKVPRTRGSNHSLSTLARFSD